MREILLLLATVGLLTSPSVAQEDSHHHEGAGQVGQLGRVTFPVSCLPAVQSRFERAVALLHSFWYEEAGRAFREIAQDDSACAMARWGEAMTLLHPLWTPPAPTESEAGLRAATLAVQLSRPGSRERAYADAIAAYYTDFATVDHKTRLLTYERAMSSLTERYPRDEEARIFYALALIANGQNDPADTTLSRQRRAGELLEPLFRRHPRHPGLAHYLIHAYDYPALAVRGVKAAGRYADIAPSVPHAQHMPSHIYVRVGRWDDVIASNLRSRESALAFERRQGSNGMWDQRAHALDYLAYAYLQERRDSEALAVVKEIDRTTAVFPSGFIGDYALAAIPARYVLERDDWAAAETLTVRPAPAGRAAEAVTYFARAIGAARSRHAGSARVDIDSLAAIEAALAKAGGSQTYWSGQVRIQRMAASAWVAILDGDTASALSQARAAAELEDVTPKHPVTPGAVLPSRELYGDLLLEARHPDEARQAYLASLALQPRRTRSLAGEALARH
jgi:tetratricopeptide (TPR) repeat protein